MLIYTSVVLIVIMGLASLCVDYGLRSLVDRELQDAADAAAAAAGTRLTELATALTVDDAIARDALIRSVAIATAEANPTTGDAIHCTTGDVEIGKWDADAATFTPSVAIDANAVRVTLERSVARNNSIRTTIGRAFGVDQLASRRSATAYVTRPPSYGLVGLDGFRAMGVLTVNGAPLYRQGSLASNGDVYLNVLNLVGVSLIDGQVVTQGTVHLPTLINLTNISGGICRPDQPFDLPVVTTQAPTAVNNNGLLGGLLASNGDMVIAVIGDLNSGVYCVQNLTIVAGALLRTHGPVTIYVRGNVTILGTVLALNGDAANFKVRVAGAGTVTIAANLTLTVDLYAPQSQVTIAVGAIYHGRLMARRVDVLGTSLFFLQPDLPPPELGRSRVALVR